MDKDSKLIETAKTIKRRKRIIHYELVRKWTAPNDVLTLEKSKIK